MVFGKGNKERLVPFGSRAKESLTLYFDTAREKLLRGKISPYVFVNRMGGKLSRKGIWKRLQDMELKSLKKKFKDKRFAAGCSREVIQQGAEMLGWELDDLLQRTLTAMQQIEDDLNAEFGA